MLYTVNVGQVAFSNPYLVYSGSELVLELAYLNSFRILLFYFNM